MDLTTICSRTGHAFLSQKIMHSVVVVVVVV